MQDYVHSGYLNLYRPPFSVLNSEFGATIYAISTRFNVALIIIPLVPNFYKDVIKLVQKSATRKIILVAPDMSIAFVSDYYLCWDAIVNTYNKECVIFSRYMPENFCYGKFKSDIIRGINNNMSIEIPRSELDVGTIDITLSKDFVFAQAPFTCDVILNDTYSKKIFISEMNKFKAKYLYDKRDEYDEIHMAYIRSNYSSMTYNELIKQYPALVSKVYCNQFASYEEFSYAREKNIKVGGVFNNDFV